MSVILKKRIKKKSGGNIGFSWMFHRKFVMNKMPDRKHRAVIDHPRPGKSHDGFDLISFLMAVTMHRTQFAGGFVFTELAMQKPFQ
jgi:hypothetical protein